MVVVSCVAVVVVNDEDEDGVVGVVQAENWHDDDEQGDAASLVEGVLP